MPISHPSVADVETVAAVADPVLRNLQITVAYGGLANAFAERLRGGANWCTFATWASKQAGRTIRREDLALAVERHVRSRLDKRPHLRPLARVPGFSSDALVRIAGQVSLALPGVERAADAVARGNLKVFAEIGRHFAQALEALAAHDSLEPAAAALKPGPPPEGQDLLRRAFRDYQAAIAATDAAARDQAAFAANVRIGLHEQTRLQPEIREAMDAGLLDVAELRRAILDRLDALVPPAIRAGALKEAVNIVVDDLAQELRSAVRVVLTELLMTIGLPRGRTLRLGSDLAQRFPESLKVLGDPELVALVATFDPTLDSVRGSGAMDWAVLPQRMRFIGDFFRSSHADASLLDAPFPRAALDTIAAGRIPLSSALA